MTPKDMMVIDANAESMGIPKASLMENAGRCVAHEISEISKPCKVAIFAGTGGNGGDGFVACRHLLNMGFEVEVFLLANPSKIKTKETHANWVALECMDLDLSPLKIKIIEDSSYLGKIDAEIIVDAILGTGIKGKLKEPVSSAIDIINEAKGTKVAIDVPSGLDPLTGDVHDKAMMADITITLHKKKIGLKKADPRYPGKLVVCDIGIPREVEIIVGPGDLLRLDKRDPGSHKGNNGKVLVVGGSSNYSGAPALAALSSFKTGVDLVFVACPASVSSTIRSYSPDLIVRSLSDEFIVEEDVDTILELSENVDSVVIGCGIGTHDGTSSALNHLVSKIKKPTVIDADALRMLKKDTFKKIAKNNVVLTPHAAEFKAIFGLNVPEALKKKVKVISEASKKSGCVILQKGMLDIISNGEKTRINKTGNPGMTVGGTGDCLAGVVTGLIAQGLNNFEASCLAAFINGRAGDLAMKKYGYSFTATDLLNLIPKAFL